MNPMRQFFSLLPLHLIGRGLRHILSGRAGRRLAPPMWEVPPWCSPDVWDRIHARLASIERPTLVEFGTGSSTLWHLRAILERGGTLVAVEHEAGWFIRVLWDVLRFVRDRGMTAVGESSSAGRNLDTRLRLSGSDGRSAELLLRYRPKSILQRDPVTGQSDYEDYVAALDLPCDVVILDGGTRKACVRRALETEFLRRGGLLVLLDAGRGTEGWLGRPTREGKADYQPEVERMLDLGGEWVDGAGMDRWPGLAGRPSRGPHGDHYPREACFLVRP